MTWTTPKTWVTGEPLTASDLNTHLKDNLNALKEPPTDHYECDETSDYTTTSTSFVDVDNTNLSLTITTSGGDVLVGFSGCVINSGLYYTKLDVAMDGTRIGGDDGIVQSVQSYTRMMSFVRLVTGVSAGTHVFKLQWAVSGGTGTLYAGAGTVSGDIHAQFWAREVS